LTQVGEPLPSKSEVLSSSPGTTKYRKEGRKEGGREGGEDRMPQKRPSQ
jgi:hypothetical protein